MSLSVIADRKTVLEQATKTERLQHKASRTIQRMFWRRQLRRAHPEPVRRWHIQLRLSRTRRSSELASPHRSRLGALCRTSSGRYYSVFGAVWTSIGIFLWSYVRFAIDAQQVVCVEKLGDLASCLRPRPYFASGLFAKTACHFELAEEAACDGGRLGGGYLLEAPHIYKTMVRLKRINVSHNPENLLTVPSSWSHIPDLQVLDAAGSENFYGLPWSLCNDNISIRSGGGDGIELNLSGTVASTRLDWSRQLAVTAGTRVGISTNCTNALQNTLKSLDLSGNNLTLSCKRITDAKKCFKNSLWIDGVACTEPTCGASLQLDWIRPFKHLEFLSLTDNGITVLARDFFEITAVSLESALETGQGSAIGVDLSNNPLKAVLLSVLPVQRTVQILHYLGSSGTYCPSITSLQLSSIYLANNSGAFDRDVLKSLRDACFHDSLTHLHLVNIPWWGKGPDQSALAWLAGNSTSSPPSTIESGSFETLSSLRELKLTDMLYSGLRIIRGEAFRGLQRLETLELVRLGINTIEDGVFFGLPALKRINIRECSGVGAQLASGQALAAVGNSLTELDLTGSLPSELRLKRVWLANMTNLETLVLANWRYCKEKNIAIDAGVFVNMAKLRLLDLSGNNLRSADLLDGAIFDGLSALETLILSHNLLSTQIDNRTFSHLSGLRTLFLWPQGALFGSNWRCLHKCNTDGGTCVNEETNTTAWGLPPNATVRSTDFHV